MTEEVKNNLIKLIEETIDKNSDKCNTFIRYYGHTGTIQISKADGGWSKFNEDVKILDTTLDDPNLFSKIESAKERLNKKEKVKLSICPECGYKRKTNKDYQYCPKCGKELEDIVIENTY